MHEGRNVLHIVYRAPPLYLTFRAFSQPPSAGAAATIRIFPTPELRTLLDSPWDQRSRVYDRVISHIRSLGKQLWQWSDIDVAHVSIEICEEHIPSAYSLALAQLRKKVFAFVRHYSPPLPVVAAQSVSVLALAAVHGQFFPDFNRFLLILCILLLPVSLILNLAHASKAFEALMYAFCLTALARPQPRSVLVKKAIAATWRIHRAAYLVSIVLATAIFLVAVAAPVRA